MTNSKDERKTSENERKFLILVPVRKNIKKDLLFKYLFGIIIPVQITHTKKSKKSVLV